jgi:hypothetical protein
MVQVVEHLPNRHEALSSTPVLFPPHPKEIFLISREIQWGQTGWVTYLLS